MHRSPFTHRLDYTLGVLGTEDKPATVSGRRECLNATVSFLSALSHVHTSDYNFVQKYTFVHVPIGGYFVGHYFCEVLM